MRYARLRPVLLLPVLDCPSAQIALHLGEALLAGKVVQLLVTGPVTSELAMLAHAYGCIYPHRVFVASTATPGWSTAAGRGEIVIVTARDAFYSDRPWLRLAGDRESSWAELLEFYPPEEPGFRVA